MARLGISCFIIISLTITFGYFLGIFIFLTDYEKNGCDMTYMYEYPQFVRVSVKEDERFEKYGLYAYSEGHLTKNVRNMHFDGIPVLFIPGNAGSYRQVRSFASVSLRKAMDSRRGFHFDFFTVNLNDELSGLNGALLNEQMAYVNHSISRILQLYRKNRHTCRSLFVIAHSMGGIIARGLLASLPDDSKLLPVIITLATPHLRPPAALDHYMVNFYKKIEENKFTNNNSTVVALSGGFNDFLVSPFYTNTQRFNLMHIMSTSVPLVWLSIDHLCILWCKQLVLAVTRSIFDLVDPNSHQIKMDPEYHRAVFTHHLVQHNGVKQRKLGAYKTDMNFSAIQDKWVERLQRQYSVHLVHGRKVVEWHMIRLIDHSDHEYLTVLAINLEVTDWVFVCSATHLQNQQRICLSGSHLSHLSEIVPSVRNKRRKLTINMFELKRNFTTATHVVVRVLPTHEPVTLHMDIYGDSQRKLNVTLPQWWAVMHSVIIEQTEEKMIHYTLQLRQLYHIIQSYKLYVEPLTCSHTYHHAVATLHIPWSNQNIHKYIIKNGSKPLDLRLFSSRPHGLNASFPSVQLILDPTCSYRVSIRSSIFGMIGNMARTYTPLLVANVAAVILLTFKDQLLSIDETGSCSVFFTAMTTGIKPYYILTMVKISSRVLSWKVFTQFLPITDWQMIAEEGNDFFLLPLLLYMCGVGIVWLISLGLASSLFVCEASVNKMAFKFLSHSISGALYFSDWILHGLHKLPSLVAITLIVLSFATCGGVALLFGCVFYFMKLTKMSQEYVETVVIEYVKYYAEKIFKRQSQLDYSSENNYVQNIATDPETSSESSDNDSDTNSNAEHNTSNENTELVQQITRGEPTAYSALFFHFSIMLLWSVITAIHVPHVLTWARNFKYSTELKPDPSFLPGLILSVCAIPLWQLDIPRVNKCWYMPLSEMFNLIAAASLLYAPISLYRLVYLLTAAIVLITLHQMFAPDRTDEEEIDDNTRNDPDLDSEINKMKAKLE